MNLRILVCSVVVAAFPVVTWGVVQICYDSAVCFGLYQKEWCCPTGSQGTRQVCPAGWTLKSSGNCTRASSTTYETSDSQGYKVAVYGSCTASTETYLCYSGSDYDKGSVPIGSGGLMATCVERIN